MQKKYLLLDCGITILIPKLMPEFKEYISDDGKLVVKLAKPMYGLIKSVLLWYKELTGFLEEQGFRKNKTDGCILHKVTEDGRHTMLLDHVDDLLILSETEELCNSIKLLIEEKYEKKTSVTGNKTNYLGMIQETLEGCFTISMKAYIMDVLKEHGKDEAVIPRKKRKSRNLTVGAIFGMKVKQPTIVDIAKLERVLGYLKLTSRLK